MKESLARHSVAVAPGCASTSAPQQAAAAPPGLPGAATSSVDYAERLSKKKRAGKVAAEVAQEGAEPDWGEVDEEPDWGCGDDPSPDGEVPQDVAQVARGPPQWAPEEDAGSAALHAAVPNDRRSTASQSLGSRADGAERVEWQYMDKNVLVVSSVGWSRSARQILRAVV